MARMRAVGVVMTRQGGDRHRALALPIDLHQFVAEGGYGGGEIGRVHRPAAVDDGLEAARIDAVQRHMLGESLEHGRRGEQGDVGVPPKRIEYALGIEWARQDDVVGAAREMGQPVKPGEVWLLPEDGQTVIRSAGPAAFLRTYVPGIEPIA